MIARIGLALLCLILAGCGVQPPASAPYTAEPPAGYAIQPQLATPLSPDSAPTLPQPDTNLVATSVAATAAALPANPATDPAGANADQATSPADILLLPTRSAGAAVVPLTGAVTLLTLDQLLDFSLADSTGARIGQVQDLVIDLNPGTAQGTAPYLVASIQTNEDWLVFIPWQYFQVIPARGLVQLSIPASQFQTAPGCHEDAMPASLPDEWRAALRRYWLNPAQPAAMPALPAPGAAAQRSYLTASDLFDIEVVDGRFFALGEIKDIAVDWAASQPGSAAAGARFAYVIMERDDALGPGAENIPIPWSRLQINLPQEIAVLNLTPQALLGAPAFADLAWPDLYSEPWNSDLNQFWNP